jgi:hypothetical protein
VTSPHASGTTAAIRTIYRSIRKGYRSWKQAAGYFDGDGTVILVIRQNVIVFYLNWVDTSKAQIEQLLVFLRARGVSTGKVYAYPHQKAFTLAVSRIESVRLVAKRLLPFVFKKWNELRILLDYYSDQITGNEAIERINAEVSSGSRSGYLHNANLPLVRSKGKHTAHMIAGRKAWSKVKRRTDSSCISS